MKRLLAALLFIPGLALAQQNTAIDRDKHTENGAPVSWLTTRTNGYDALHVVVDSGGGGGGGAVTIADGADVTLGAKADAAATTDTGTFTLQALTKRSLQKLTTISGQLPAALGSTTSAASLSVTPASDAAFKMSNLPTTVDTNSGVKSASTLRVVLATDQPQLTNKLLVTPDSVALPANQSVNVSQINGVTPLMGAGNSGTGAQRVIISTDQPNVPVAVKTAVGPANITTGQVTAGGAATLVAANTTRRQCTIKNTDASLTVYIGPATVTSANGMPVKAGESIVVRSTALIQVVAASGSPVVSYMDEYD